MNYKHSILEAIAILSIVTIGCSGTTKSSVDNGDEESVTQFALDETYDKVRKWR